MSRRLSQAELYPFLGIKDDSQPQDLGSENFKRLYNEYDEWRSTLEKGYSPKRIGINPEEILEDLEQTLKNYKQFQVFFKKFKIIAEKEPEIFI